MSPPVAMAPATRPTSGAANLARAVARRSERERSTSSPAPMIKTTSRPASRALRASGTSRSENSASAASSMHAVPGCAQSSRACSRATEDRLPTSASTGPSRGAKRRAAVVAGRKRSAAGK